MTKNEAINRLRKNVDNWRINAAKLDYNDIVEEINKDYEAIEILLAQTSLDYESMTWEELNEIFKIIVPLKKKKYPSSATRRAGKAKYLKKIASSRKSTREAKERQKISQKKYAEKNRERIREYNRNYQRERRRKKKMENEANITLFR